MYEVALTVQACLGAGTRAYVAWVVEAASSLPLDPAEALAITPGGGRVGSVMAGALNDQLAELATGGSAGRLVDLEVTEVDALVAGLQHGGSTRCMIMDAVDLPTSLWDRLADRQPLCLVARIDAGRVVATEVYDANEISNAGVDAVQLFERGTSAASVEQNTVVTVLWPVPRLVIVGGGPIVEAINAGATLLGWRTQVFTDARAATASIVGLSALDKLVVFSHDIDAAGSTLLAGLSSRVGYIGALGSRRMQRDRADWLATRGVSDLDRIHGPAGIDIGATKPAEIAVSVLAEAIAVRADARIAQSDDAAATPT